MKHIKEFESFISEARMSIAQSWLNDYEKILSTL